MNHHTHVNPSSHADEIDLVDLFSTIWLRKWIVVLLTAAGIFISAMYAWLSPQVWKSYAYINQPRVSEIFDYLELRRTLARADGNHVVDRGALASSLFNEFVRQFTSENRKRQFLEGHPYINERANIDSERARALAVEAAAQNLVIEAPEEGVISPHYTVSFSALTAEQARETLQDYLLDTNRRAIEIFDAEFKDALTASISTRKTEREMIERELVTKRRNWIDELTAALDTARAAGITNYMEGRAIDGSVIVELSERQRLFMLGETFLAAELKTAQESPIIFPVRYYEIADQLAMLEPMLDYQAPEVMAFRYLLEPTLPLTRESPRRTLLVALGAILGLMLGILTALISGTVASSRAQRIAQLKAGEEAALRSIVA